ncbi:hypothetical protein [Streptosporangium fragile]
MDVDDGTRENDRDETTPLPIEIRRLDKIETTGFPASSGNSN